MENKHKKILIVGGGVAGIALAVFLQDSDYEITLIERAPAWRTIGYGVGLWNNGLKILEKLNLGSAFWSQTTLVKKGAIIKPDGRMICEIPADRLDLKEIARTVERDVLHAALHNKLASTVAVRFATDTTSIVQEDDSVRVGFSDGTTERFDLVVGADGMRSRVRSSVFGDYLKSYGWSANIYWAKKTTGMYDDYYIATAFGRVFLNMPCGDRCVVGFGYLNGAPKKKSTKTPEQVLREYSALSPQMKNIVESIDYSSEMFSDELHFVSMRDWFKGNVVLIGDARHGLSPISGFGTTLALEDAYVLSEILKKETTVQTALKKFARQRDKEMKDINHFAKVMEGGLLARLRFVRLPLSFVPSWYPIRLLKKAIR